MNCFEDKKYNNFLSVRRRPYRRGPQDEYDFVSCSKSNPQRSSGECNLMAYKRNLSDRTWHIPNLGSAVTCENFNQQKICKNVENIITFKNEFNRKQGNNTLSCRMRNYFNEKYLDSGLGENFSWHKCNHNDSVIHVCNKSKMKLHYNRPTEESKQNVKNISLYEAGYIPKIQNTFKNFNNSYIHMQNVNSEIYKVSNQNFMKIASNNNNSKEMFKKIYKVESQSMSNLTDLQHYLHIPDQVKHVENTIKNQFVPTYNYKTSSKESTSLVLQEKEIYETSNESLKNIQEESMKKIKNLIDSCGDLRNQPNIEKTKISYDLNLDQENSTIDIRSVKEPLILRNMLTVFQKIYNDFQLNTATAEGNNQLKLISIISQEALQEYIYNEYVKYLEIMKTENMEVNKLGSDQDSSILFILKTMEGSTDSIFPLLSPRQKIKLAMAIFSSMNNFRINETVWSTVCLDVINYIQTLMKNNI